nr:hypothetical protein [Tanacetum cinerariifolium]
MMDRGPDQTVGPVRTGFSVRYGPRSVLLTLKYEDEREQNRAAYLDRQQIQRDSSRQRDPNRGRQRADSGSRQMQANRATDSDNEFRQKIPRHCRQTRTAIQYLMQNEAKPYDTKRMQSHM